MTTFKSEMGPQDIEILTKDSLYEGHLHLLKYQVRYRLFAGQWSSTVTREAVNSRHAVGVLLFDPIRDEIVLIEEFRIGALHQQGGPWLLEIVAGLMEPNESFAEVATREAQEEAGCHIMDLFPIYEYWTSPGMSTGKFTLFCGRIDASQAGGIFGVAHENEDIKAHVFPKAFVYEALASGQIVNAATIIAVQWLQLHERKVKQQWLASP